MMSNISGVTAGGSATTTSETTVTKERNDMLGKDAFLQLLVTQLRYQDPLSPMDNKDFIAQMAQFTALEQSQNMSGQIQRLNALSMLGLKVTIEPKDGGDVVSGVVEKVVSVKGVSKLAIDGKQYNVDDVVAVE